MGHVDRRLYRSSLRGPRRTKHRWTEAELESGPISLAASVVAARLAHPGDGIPASAAFELQRAMGNKAVTHLLAPARSRPGVPTVQRNGKGKKRKRGDTDELPKKKKRKLDKPTVEDVEEEKQVERRSTRAVKRPERFEAGGGQKFRATKTTTKPTQVVPGATGWPWKGSKLGTSAKGTAGAGTFSGFLKRNPTPSVQQGARRDLVMTAWVLDQDAYALAALLQGSFEGPGLVETEALDDAKLTLDEVSTWLRTQGAPGPDDSAELHLPFVGRFFETQPQWLLGEISNERMKRGESESSTIRWHGLTEWGAGTGVTLEMRPGDIPSGSEAAGDPLWMKQVEQHIPATGGASGTRDASTIFVRGHLLNYDLGGPGIDYNMVPLTGKGARGAGANDANNLHSTQIEIPAKRVWEAVQAGTCVSGRYEVVAELGRPPRSETAVVAGEAQKMRDCIEKALAAHVQSLDPSAIETEFVKLYGPQAKALYPTSNEQREALWRALGTAARTTTLGELRSSGSPLAATIDKHVNRDVLQASARNDADAKTPDELLYLLKGNAETWQAEDKFVPKALKCHLEWSHSSGQKDSGDRTINVELPTDAAKVHFRPFLKTELKQLETAGETKTSHIEHVERRAEEMELEDVPPTPKNQRLGWG